MGGTPKNPDIIEGWVRTKMGLSVEEEVQSVMRRTMIENGTWKPEMTQEEIDEASKQVAQLKETSGFKVDPEFGLYLDQRQLKAALKESTNILYAGDKWGPTKKGPRQFLTERVFVTPDHLCLGRMEPDGVEMVIGHIIGPQGPRSTLGYHEYVLRAVLDFDVLVARDAIQPEWWIDIWTHMEENGLGALRSQGYGRFDLLAWEKVDLLSNAPARVPAVLSR
jgi:hypothetical protein